MIKVLVTGAGGFIGQFLIPILAKNHQVRAFDKKKVNFNNEVEVMQGDLGDFKTVRMVTSGVEAIVHLGGITGGKETVLTFDTNIRGTYQLLEAAVENKVKKVIFASSIAALGCLTEEFFIPEYLPIDENHPCKPRDAYGLSKFLGEEILKFYTRKTGIVTITLRFSAVVDTNTYTSNPDRHVLWSIVDVRDVVQSIELALWSQIKGNETFNITTNKIWAEGNTLKLIKENYSEVKLTFGGEYFRKTPRASLLATEKAKKLLRFKPQYEERRTKCA